MIYFLSITVTAEGDMLSLQLHTLHTADCQALGRLCKEFGISYVIDKSQVIASANDADHLEQRC
jgi:hypothetical protein